MSLSQIVATPLLARPAGDRPQCPRCQHVWQPQPWVNPLRRYARRQGWLPPDAPETGGWVLCYTCLEQLQAEEVTTRSLSTLYGIAPDHPALDDITPVITQREVYTAFQDYLASPRGDLFLYGGTGTGKTLLITALAVSWRQLDLDRHARPTCSIRLVRAPALLRHLTGMMTGEVPIEQTPEWSCGILIIDDLCSARATDYARSVLTELLEARREQHLRTWVTSNADGIEGVSRFFGDTRLSSRLATAELYSLTGPDLRYQKRPPIRRRGQPAVPATRRST